MASYGAGHDHAPAFTVAQHSPSYWRVTFDSLPVAVVAAVSIAEDRSADPGRVPAPPAYAPAV
ncbi:hypothetical protein, partial [Streptomyces sp. NPDC002346]